MRTIATCTPACPSRDDGHLSRPMLKRSTYASSHDASWRVGRFRAARVAPHLIACALLAAPSRAQTPDERRPGKSRRNSPTTRQNCSRSTNGRRSATTTWLICNLFKMAVRRPRPRAYIELRETGSVSPGTQEALSFYSLHTALAATLASTARVHSEKALQAPHQKVPEPKKRGPGGRSHHHVENPAPQHAVQALLEGGERSCRIVRHRAPQLANQRE